MGMNKRKFINFLAVESFLLRSFHFFAFPHQDGDDRERESVWTPDYLRRPTRIPPRPLCPGFPRTFLRFWIPLGPWVFGIPKPRRPGWLGPGPEPPLPPPRPPRPPRNEEDCWFSALLLSSSTSISSPRWDFFFWDWAILIFPRWPRRMASGPLTAST